MNVFILGLPYSGKTTVAKAIEKSLGLIHLNISDWIVCEVRKQFNAEHEQQFKEKLQEVYFDLLKQDPLMCVNQAHELMVKHGLDKNYIIEGVVTPKDFIHLFNINKDIVVFLNRTDNGEYYQDHDNIAMPTMKDYCFWMSSGGLLQKRKWLEYNFKIPGEQSDYIKILGSKNSVFLVKSIDKVISHLEDKLKELFV